MVSCLGYTARLLTDYNMSRIQHIPFTPIFKKLHWLPVKQSVTYKILFPTYKSIHSLAPKYITDLLHLYSLSRSLRSTGKVLLSIPQTKNLW